jgi:hypothetical protein
MLRRSHSATASSDTLPWPKDIRQPGCRDLEITAARHGGLLFELAHHFLFGDFDFCEMACADFRDKFALGSYLIFGRGQSVEVEQQNQSGDEQQ